MGLPGLQRLREYQRSWLRQDALGGLTVGAMLIPQSMAYAELGGMPPQAGFYAVLLALPVYALFGTSRHLGVGPEPGTAILSATAVAAIAGGDPARYAALMALLAILVAAVCALGAAARLGFFADLLSRPVLVGYISGVGLALISSQLGKVTGVAIESSDVVGRVVELGTRLGEVHLLTALIGLSTLAVILLLRRWRAIPGALVSVALATAIAAAFSLADRGVAVVGAIPQGLPPLGIPQVSGQDVVALLPAALGVTLVGYSDNVLTARAIATEKRYRVDSNQELSALGLANLASGLSSGFPISSSASRSFVPASLGTHSQLTSIVAAAFVAASLVFLGPVLATFPAAALGGVILAAAVAIIDVDGFVALWRLNRVELGLAVVTAAGVIVFDVLVGVLIALALSACIALWRIARPHDAVLGGVDDLDGWVPVDEFPAAKPLPGLLVYRFDAPLFFANANYFRQRVRHALDINPSEEDWLIFDFDGVGSIDTTAVQMLVTLTEDLFETDITHICVARANARTLEALERAGLLAPQGPIRSFPTINSGVRAFRESRR